MVDFPAWKTGACPILQATQGDLLQPAGVGTSARCGARGATQRGDNVWKLWGE